MPNFKETSRVRQCFMKHQQIEGWGVQATENDTGSSDTCVTKCYSINSRDDLHQSESLRILQRDPPPFYLLENIDYRKLHSRGLLI